MVWRTVGEGSSVAIRAWAAAREAGVGVRSMSGRKMER